MVDCRKGTYQVQTNLSVQIVQTLIWATGSTSKGGAEGVGGGGICKSVITQSKVGQLIVKLPNPPCPLDVDLVVQIGVCTVGTERLVCT